MEECAILLKFTYIPPQLFAALKTVERTLSKTRCEVQQEVGVLFAVFVLLCQQQQ